MGEGQRVRLVVWLVRGHPFKPFGPDPCQVSAVACLHHRQFGIGNAGDTVQGDVAATDGDLDQTVESLKIFGKIGLENIVQGHGDIVLRGEIENYIKENIQYLMNIRRVVKKASKRKYPAEILDESYVEDCGKSRILISGLSGELHNRNLRALYKQMFGEEPREPEYGY